MDCNILSNPSIWTFPALQSKMKIRNVPSWMPPHDQGEGINKETGRQAWSIGPNLVFVFYPDNILSRRKFLFHKLHNGCNLDSLLLESLWDGTPREGVQAWYQLKERTFYVMVNLCKAYEIFHFMLEYLSISIVTFFFSFWKTMFNKDINWYRHIMVIVLINIYFKLLHSFF